MSGSRLNLLSFSGNTRILHLSWFAFFLTFLVWFNHALLFGGDNGWRYAVAATALLALAYMVTFGSELAVVSMVPLVKRRLTGQIAGMTGAYGNVADARHRHEQVRYAACPPP